MNILVTGSDGMLGSAIIPYLRQCGHDVYDTDIDTLDVRDRDAVRWGITSVSPTLVAHLAAETSLEACEDNPDHAWLTNAIGTKNVALECRRAQVPMAYISSAGIFDGESSEAYTEFDAPNPINVYGASKWQGELYMRQFVPPSYTVRAGWMMGGGPGKDHKFVSHILSQINDGAEIIHAVKDKFGSPTFAPDFAKCFESLITSGDYGTYHMVSSGECSRYDVARAILDILGRDDIVLSGTSSNYFIADFYAPRPTSEVMRNYVLDLTGRNSMRPWREALEDYLRDWK